MSGLQLEGTVSLTTAAIDDLLTKQLTETMLVVESQTGRTYAANMTNLPTYYMRGIANLNSFVYCRAGTHGAAPNFSQGAGDDGYFFFDWDRSAAGAGRAGGSGDAAFTGTDAQWSDKVAMKEVKFTKLATESWNAGSSTFGTNAVGDRPFDSGIITTALPTTNDSIGSVTRQVPAGKIFLQDANANVAATYEPGAVTPSGAMYDISFYFKVTATGILECNKADVAVTRSVTDPAGQTTVITVAEDTSQAQQLSLQNQNAPNTAENPATVAGVPTQALPPAAFSRDILRMQVSNTELQAQVQAAINTAADAYNNSNLISNWSITFAAIKPTLDNGADNTNNVLSQRARYLIKQTSPDGINQAAAVALDAKVFKANEKIWTKSSAPYHVTIIPVDQVGTTAAVESAGVAGALTLAGNSDTANAFGAIFGIAVQNDAGKALAN